jgi:hypothetical protein
VADRLIRQPREMPNLSLSVNDWLHVLKLASIWGLDALRATAIKNVDQQLKTIRGPVGCTRERDGSTYISSVDHVRIKLARKYRISSWLIKGYVGLCKRDAVLAAEDQEYIGYSTYFKLLEVREESWQWAVRSAGKRSRRRAEFPFEDMIRTVFDQELKLDTDYTYGPNSS